MGYKGSKVSMAYAFKLLPDEDSVMMAYKNYEQKFGESGNVLVIGFQSDNLFELEKFNALFDLSDSLKKFKGVENVLSVANSIKLNRNDSLKKFDIAPLVEKRVDSQNELDSIKAKFYSLPFYKNKIYNPETGAFLIAINIEKKILDSKERDKTILGIEATVKDYLSIHFEKIHVSGLPYIRTNNTTKIAQELKLFTLMAILVTAFILYLFFRSIKITFFSMLVVGIAVVWSLGTVGIFNYEISILLGLIPPLIIVIGIPNCVFLINKYHSELRNHGNQARALVKTIEKIGSATLLTNTTTALGFATFIFTNSDLLKEFGVIASINILGVFFLSLILIPVIFSYLEVPKVKSTKHLENKFIQGILNKFIFWVENKRAYVFTIAIFIVVFSIVGITFMHTTGNISDDLPRNGTVYQDLKFFEDNFNGVMPFEVLVDVKKDGAATQLPNLIKINKLQDLMESYPALSRPLSIVDVVKFGKQSYYGGSPSKYDLPNNMEKGFLAPFLLAKSEDKSASDVMGSFIDRDKRVIRVSSQMKDIGTEEMEELKADIKIRIDSILDPKDYDVTLTGNSIVFLQGTTYLVNNLLVSLSLAIIVISIMMSLLFSSFRMVLVSLLPNFIPLLLTAGLMGYANIPIKPSTILVFSIAFGISVDDTIHYLAKYRQELKSTKWNIKKSVINALRESGVSMIYTSIILFFGFGIFALSNFGGTVALGVLVSVTLLVAMLSNLLVLPSILLFFEKGLSNKDFTEPIIHIAEEKFDKNNLNE
jgi:uncharacterized protein